MKAPGKKRAKRPEPALIGWREWVALPELGIRHIKAKVDTGARTSSLHALDIRRVRRGGKRYVRFKVHPWQRDSKTTVKAVARLVEERKVRSSSGDVSLRPVIRTELRLLDRCCEIELTLVSRDEMGFRMLLGREALRGRFLVNPGSSFASGRPLRRRAKKKKKPR